MTRWLIEFGRDSFSAKKTELEKSNVEGKPFVVGNAAEVAIMAAAWADAVDNIGISKVKGIVDEDNIGI